MSKTFKTTWKKVIKTWGSPQKEQLIKHRMMGWEQDGFFSFNVSTGEGVAINQPGQKFLC